MATKRKPTKKYKGYTATEADLLHFGQWLFMISFVFLTIAAIITTNSKLMFYSIIVGIFLAYGLWKKWFSI